MDLKQVHSEDKHLLSLPHVLGNVARVVVVQHALPFVALEERRVAGIGRQSLVTSSEWPWMLRRLIVYHSCWLHPRSCVCIAQPGCGSSETRGKEFLLAAMPLLKGRGKGKTTEPQVSLCLCLCLCTCVCTCVCECRCDCACVRLCAISLESVTYSVFRAHHHGWTGGGRPAACVREPPCPAHGGRS